VSRPLICDSCGERIRAGDRFVSAQVYEVPAGPLHIRRERRQADLHMNHSVDGILCAVRWLEDRR
jgi:hypothetical protein